MVGRGVISTGFLHSNHDRALLRQCFQEFCQATEVTDWGQVVGIFKEDIEGRASDFAYLALQQVCSQMHDTANVTTIEEDFGVILVVSAEGVRVGGGLGMKMSVELADYKNRCAALVKRVEGLQSLRREQQARISALKAELASGAID